MVDTIMGSVLGLLTGIVVVIAMISSDFTANTELVKHGCSEYDKTTGLIQWEDK